MANWFKIYETDLDEKRLKYALNKLPEVGWVWIGILSECCKHRSDTIRYSRREVDMFGFSDALNVSIPKLNAAFLLLAEIEYIEIGDREIRVIKWDSKQSEYNHRKCRGDYRRVSDNIGDSPLEESRVEESRVEDKRGENKREEEGEAPNAALPPPSVEIKEVFDAWNALNSGLPKCLVVSTKRRLALKARLREPFFKEHWRAAMAKLPESDFLTGINDRGWIATFDWFISPEAVPKIIEGKYENRSKNSKNKPFYHI